MDIKSELQSVVKDRLDDILDEVSEELEVGGTLDKITALDVKEALSEAIDEVDEVLRYLQGDRRKRRTTILSMHHEGASLEKIARETAYKRQLIRPVLRQNAECPCRSSS